MYQGRKWTNQLQVQRTHNLIKPEVADHGRATGHAVSTHNNRIKSETENNTGGKERGGHIYKAASYYHYTRGTNH